jgi:hypothetical protein
VKLLDNTGWEVSLARPPTGMAAYVQQRVAEIDRQVLLERRLQLDDEGRGVVLRYLLIDDTDRYAWRIDPDPELEATEERNQRIRDFLKELEPEAQAAYANRPGTKPR